MGEILGTVKIVGNEVELGKIRQEIEVICGMIVRKCGKMLEEWGNFRENSVENQGNLAKKKIVGKYGKVVRGILGNL